MKRGVKIERGIQPIIKSNIKHGRPCKYPFDALKVGQAFWVNGSNGSYVNLYVAVWRHNRVSQDRKFVLTKGVKGGRDGYRVQRTS